MSTVTTDAGRVAALEAEIARLRDEHAVALALVADVRFACGDYGQRMQPELLEYLRELAADAARYRWLAAHARSTSEHWGGRWSLVIDGPAPVQHNSEDALDEAVDAAMAGLAAKGGA